jgi:diaminohydroxyphosphoribosylaminopyrimidine deaminase/5-amino-6-(5-phosphoribosylamino)uracil reductase
MVGAVVAADDGVVGEGYHHGAGSPHAEVLALEQAREKARGATLYVTLEPCCHFGRTPPCTRRIIDAGIKRVVAGVVDPDPRVCGKGAEELRKAGVQVEFGVLEGDTSRLIEPHRKFAQTGLPFVTLKLATSLDGRIATRTRQTRWITGEKARRYAHRLRAESDVVMVGIGTASIDDPLLTARLVRASRQPARVVVDTRARLEPTARMLQDSGSATIVATTENAPSDSLERLRKAGAEVLVLPENEGRVDLRSLLKELGQRGIRTVLVEGGAALAGSLMDERLVDKVVFVIAPILIGGSRATSALGGKGADDIGDALRLADVRVRRIARDIVVQGYLPGE